MEKDKAMLPIKYHRALILAVACILTAASIWGAAFSAAGDAEAHQPEGLRISLSDMPEPPCTYWHDDACEYATPPLYSVNPFQSNDPHAHLHNIDAGNYDHHEHLESIAALNQQVQARLAVSGDAPEEADSDPRAPGGDVSYAITSDITGLPWVSDGQTEAEKVTVAWLSELQNHNPSLVTSLVGMPFLQDHTPGDLQAIQTLTYISRGTSLTPANPQYATALATHTGFADGGGIDNTEARIIAVTSMPYFQGADALINLLASQGNVEELSVQGKHDNPLMFAIVRTTPFNSASSGGGSPPVPKEPQKEPFIQTTSVQNSELMQSLNSATRHSETLMAQALPTDFVGALVYDLPGASAANNNIHLWFDLGFDETYSDRVRQRVVAHEIGHYWWSRNNDHEAWISEGAAEYIGAYSEKTQFDDSRLYTDNWPCPYYRTIEHLRADNPDYRYSQGSLCNYSLGERLFINLERSIGHTAFAAGFRNLHQRLSTYADDEIDQGLSLMNAFCLHCLTPAPDDTDSDSTQVVVVNGQVQVVVNGQVVVTHLGGVGHALTRWYGEKILTDASEPTGIVAGLGSSPIVSLRDYGHHSRQFGIAEVSASSPDQRRWLQLYFNNASNPPETVTVAVRQYHEERYPYYSVWQERMVYQRESGPAAWFNVYLGGLSNRRAIGHHWVYIYNENGEKIAKAEYQVVP